MIYKLFGIVVTIIIGAIIGLRLSKDINNGVLYTLFWILYAITYLTFSNIIAVSLFYSILQNKTGPPGQRGPQGETGNIGALGVCQDDCNEIECSRELKNYVVEMINKIANNPVPPIRLNNLLLLNQVNNLCTSKQFKKVAEIKGATPAINYVKDILKDWIDILYDSGGTAFFEEAGAEENYTWKNGRDPFKEIEKYDIYYWNMNKLFKPIGVDICDDPDVNKNLPQADKEKPLLYMIKTNIYENVKSNKSHHIFKPVSSYNKKIKYNMYPMGDVAVSGGNENSGPKYIDGMSAPENGNDGPKKSSVLIAGNVTKPLKFIKVGDYYKMVPKTGYKCLGDVGGTSPLTYDYRCIPEECAERVSDTLNNGQLIYKNDSGIWGIPDSESNGLGNDIGYKNYNLFRATKTDGNHNGFYKIKDSCLTTAKPTNIPVGEGDWISNRWFGYPERNSKYSIFTFLGIVPEGMLINKETGTKYHFITTTIEPNSFFIKFFNVGHKKYGNLEVVGNSSVGINYTVNRDKKEQLWYLDYKDPNNVYVRSIKTKKYMGLHYYHNEEGTKIEDDKKHLLKILQYKKPFGNRTKWKIQSTTTGQRNIKQRKNGKLKAQTK